MAFVFERHSVYNKSAQVIYDAIFERHKGDPKLHSLTHVRKNAYVALQPADYLAFQLGHFFLDPASKKSQRGMSILGDGNVEGVRLERKQIERMVKALIAKGPGTCT